TIKARPRLPLICRISPESAATTRRGIVPSARGTMGGSRISLSTISTSAEGIRAFSPSPPFLLGKPLRRRWASICRRRRAGLLVLAIGRCAISSGQRCEILIGHKTGAAMAPPPPPPRLPIGGRALARFTCHKRAPLQRRYGSFHLLKYDGVSS